MIKLEAENRVIKPSQRRQLLAWLKRALHLGKQVGNFALSITIRRMGKGYEIRATVQDKAGDFGCRARGQRWRDACRELVHTLTNRLHEQRLQVA